MPNGGSPPDFERKPCLATRKRSAQSSIFPAQAHAPGLKANPEQQLLLYCGPDQGGWRLGVHHDGRWRDFTDLDEVLEPSHFALLPDEPG